MTIIRLYVPKSFLIVSTWFRDSMIIIPARAFHTKSPYQGTAPKGRAWGLRSESPTALGLMRFGVLLPPFNKFGMLGKLGKSSKSFKLQVRYQVHACYSNLKLEGAQRLLHLVIIQRNPNRFVRPDETIVDRDIPRQREPRARARLGCSL